MAIVDINGNSLQQSGGDSVLNLKSTEGVMSIYNTIPLKDFAELVEVGKRANGNSEAIYTRYTLHNVKKGDIIIVSKNFNGERTTCFYAENTDLTEKAVIENYTTLIFTADKDYPTLYASSDNTKALVPAIQHRDSNMENLPSFNGKFVPMIVDSDNDVETLSNKAIYDTFGKSFIRAKKKLEGGVFIGFGDSYTVYADSWYKKLASKYEMIYDPQGKVSSTICGDEGGSKGFAPFWTRMNSFIAEYTGSGRAIDGVTYHAEDVKLIVFMGGANDGYGADTWLGSKTSKDTNFIYGSLNYMFNKLSETFKNAEIIVVLQPVNYHASVNSVGSDDAAKKMGFASLAELKTYTDYELGQYAMTRKEKAVKEVAEKFGFAIVDCVFDWYNVLNPAWRNKYWNTDKIHLTAQGSKELTEKLEKDGILKVFGN